MLALFVNRAGGGGVTTLGTLVNAVIISTFLHFSIPGWGSFQLAYAEQLIITSQNSVISPPITLSRTDDSDAKNLDDLVLVKDNDNAESTPDKKVEEIPSGSSSVGHNDSNKLQEQRFRLAQLIAAENTSSHDRISLDNLLAKAYTVRSPQGKDSKPAIRFYRPGIKDTSTVSTEVEEYLDTGSIEDSATLPPSYDAETLLALGDSLLQQSRLRDAALMYFQIVDEFPNSQSSENVDTVMNALAWDAERGYIDPNELCRFANDLPAYDVCRSDKSLYWLVAAYQIAGHSLFQTGRKKEALAYLEFGRDAAQAAMEEIPNSPYQIFFPGHYMLCCRDLGTQQLTEGMAQLRRIATREPVQSILRFAARQTLATIYNHEFHDVVEGSLQVASIVDEYAGSETEKALQLGLHAPNLRAHLEFSLGYVHFQMAHFGTSQRYFESVATAYPENFRLADAAAYMAAYMLELADQNRTSEILDAYQSYLDQWPDGNYVETALFRIAGIFDRTGELRSAVDVYDKLLTLFPNAPWHRRIHRLTEDMKASVAAGMDTQLRVDALLAQYGSQWCGPYAAALLLKSQQMEADLRFIADRAGMTALGTTLEGLFHAVSECGLAVHACSVPADAIFQAPAVAHLKPNHFVFVAALTPSEVVVEDPTGIHILQREDFNALFTGYMLTLNLPGDAIEVEPDVLRSIQGGCDIFFSDLTEAFMHCINQDYIPPCPNNGEPTFGGGAGNDPSSAPNSKGTHAPGNIHTHPWVKVPGSMADPTTPSLHPNIPFGGDTLHIGMGATQRSLSIQQTDIIIPTRGSSELALRRIYYNPWGYHRGYVQTDNRPYKNNIGNGWHHNLNVHVRLSSGNGFLNYVDANGNMKRFSRTEVDANGIDLYCPAPMDLDGEDVNALHYERSVLACRSIQEGWVELIFPDGITCHFSAPIHEEERYCRLEWFEDVSGNRFNLVYTDLWLSTPTDANPNLETNFGRLAQVHTPTGDHRYLQFNYNGNLITSVQLLKPSGASTEEIKSVSYSYGTYKPSVQSAANFLRVVEMDGNSADAVMFEYEQGEYDNQPWGMYPAKITDKEGNHLLVDVEYGLYMNIIYPVSIALTFPNDLLMVIDKPTSSITDIRTYNGQTALSRFKYTLGSHNVRVSMASYYHEPEGNTFNSWSYSYENNYDLVGVGKAAVNYWYNEEGRIKKYACGGVYYRYEYPGNGELYPIRMYGPGTASESDKGPMTEFVYDAYTRLTQIKPPDMGPNGITITYDNYGQVIARTNASGETEHYTYDDRGNRTSYTDRKNNTWTFTYDDLGRILTQMDPNNHTTGYTYTGGCSSCGGATGQIACITWPDNRQMFFDYDNNGNLIRQTDPMGHQTEYEYDSMGNLVTIISEEGRRQIFAYDKLGNMTHKKDFDGKVTRYDYDYRGLRTRVWMLVDGVPDILEETLYDDLGRLVTIKDGKEQNINFEYNNRGQITRTSHGEWCSLLDTCDFGSVHIWNDYDKYGRLWRTRAENRDPFDLFIDPIEYSYDNITGRLIQKRTINDNGTVIRDIVYDYDLNRRMVELEDWAARNVNSNGHGFAYDANGHITTYTDYDGKKLEYTYDALGRPVTMSAYEVNNDYGYAYNTGGQLASITAPGNKQWGFSYDNAGRLTSYTWPNGQYTQYTYDDDGRLTSLIHKDNPTAPTVLRGWNYSLSDSGNILRMTDARNNNEEGWEYRYDHRNRLIQAIRRTSAGIPNLRMNYVYDAADNMISQTGYNFTGRVFDDFTDGNYTDNPVWTVESGSWSAATGALVPVPQTGTRAIYTGNIYGNADMWFSFKRTGTGGIIDNWIVQARYIDENNWLGVRFIWGMLVVVQRVNGVEEDLAYTEGLFLDQDQWYEVDLQLDGSSVVLFAGKRGEELKRLTEGNTTLGAATSRLRLRMSGVMPFEFDNFRVTSRSVNLTHSMTFTYGPANQMSSMTLAGVTSNFSYDPWGRLATRSADIGGQSYTATYTYWFGDKLKRIDSNFPGETAIVAYNYDGLGKRRWRQSSNSADTFWRWDTGYSVLTEHNDTGGLWSAVGDMSRFFVPFGHTALAEAALDSTGNPDNGTYTYLAHDHLGTSRYGFDEAKTQVSAHEHLPFGQRYSVTGSAPYHEFTGKPWDPDAKLYYFPFRYYSPNMNRWTMADPAGLIDGPNMFAYVGGNAVMNHDPLGLRITTPPRRSKYQTDTECGFEYCRSDMDNSAPACVRKYTVFYHEEATWGGKSNTGGNRSGSTCDCYPAKRKRTGATKPNPENPIAKSVSCDTATCKDIQDCMLSYNQATGWGGVWAPWNNCQTGTTKVLYKCCLSR